MTIVQAAKVSSKSLHFSISTPIFYVNAAPHIGHLYTACIADCTYRYEKLRARSVKYLFSTGTDEHGMKIQQAAEKHNQTPEQYCNQISQSYKTLFEKANVNFTHFNRTTDQINHFPAVYHFWKSIADKDYIYRANYAGWYCVSDETFLTESQLKENEKKEKVSAESGHPVQWVEERNYMFKLSKFHEDIEYWIKSTNPIRPKKFQRILMEYLKEPLMDISVSRPMNRVSWGIPVPGDNSQTVYVWLDALVNYLTSAGYPDPKFTDNWPPQIQVIGKDILKFHGIYWPAFLIASGLEPPARLLVHSHWTVDDAKMSKSKHNVVDPNEVAKTYTYEGLRYFLLREGVPHSDGNYSAIKATRIINAELVNTLGNLMSRVCAEAINKHQIVPALHEKGPIDIECYQKLIERLDKIPSICEEHYDSQNFYLAIDQIIATLHMTNNMVQETQPWTLAKNPEKTEQLNAVLALAFESLRINAILLQPIIPNLCERILDKINADPEQRLWNHSKLLFEQKDKSIGNGSSKLMDRIK